MKKNPEEVNKTRKQTSGTPNKLDEKGKIREEEFREGMKSREEYQRKTKGCRR